jgi:hypothetical protein
MAVDGRPMERDSQFSGSRPSSGANPSRSRQINQRSNLRDYEASPRFYSYGTHAKI